MRAIRKHVKNGWSFWDVFVYVAGKTKHRVVHVKWGKIPSIPGEGGLGSLVACAPTELAPLHYTLQQSSWLPNKQMKSTERRFLVSSETDATDATLTSMLDTVWHSVTAYCVYTVGSTLTYFERGGREWGCHCAHDHTQDNVCQQQQQCHFERETKADNGGWFHSAVTLHAQSSEDFHM